MLTVLNQKMQPDPVITSSGCCQECPLTDLLHRWFCRGCIFASVNRRAEVSARKRSGRILCSLSAHVVRICFSPLSESERVSSPTRRVVNRVGGIGALQCAVIMMVKTKYGFHSYSRVLLSWFWANYSFCFCSSNISVSWLSSDNLHPPAGSLFLWDLFWMLLDSSWGVLQGCCVNYLDNQEIISGMIWKFEESLCWLDKRSDLKSSLLALRNR